MTSWHSVVLIPMALHVARCVQDVRRMARVDRFIYGKN